MLFMYTCVRGGMVALAGYCEVTTDGLPGDCANDDKGSFGASVG